MRALFGGLLFPEKLQNGFLPGEDLIHFIMEIAPETIMVSMNILAT